MLNPTPEPQSFSPEQKSCGNSTVAQVCGDSHRWLTRYLWGIMASPVEGVCLKVPALLSARCMSNESHIQEISQVFLRTHVSWLPYFLTCHFHMVWSPQIDVEQLLTANIGSPLADADLLSSYLTQGLEGLSIGPPDKVSPLPLMTSSSLWSPVLAVKSLTWDKLRGAGGAGPMGKHWCTALEAPETCRNLPQTHRLKLKLRVCEFDKWPLPPFEQLHVEMAVAVAVLPAAAAVLTWQMMQQPLPDWYFGGLVTFWGYRPLLAGPVSPTGRSQSHPQHCGQFHRHHRCISAMWQ